MGLIFRPLSAAAAQLRRQAFNLAQKLRGPGVLNQIYEIFILRAQKSQLSTVATVVEVPTYFVGGYGGQDSINDYYSPFAIVDLGPVLSAMTRRTLRRDDANNIITNIPGDLFRGRAFTGSGRVVIGSVPAWENYRQALNDTTGIFSVCPSACMVVVCPALGEEIEATRPWIRTVTVCRGNGYSGAGDTIYTEAGAVPADILPGHVMMTSTPPTGKAERISGLEIAQSELGIAGEMELVYAGTATEWGPLQGLFCVMFSRFVLGGPLLGHGLKFAVYDIVGTGEGAERTYTGQVVSIVTVDDSTIPSSDAPTALSEVPSPPPDYNFPSWATAHTTINGRSARQGRLTMRDPNTYTSVFSANAGYPTDSPEPVLSLVEIRSEVEAAEVSVRGYRASDTADTITTDVPAATATRTVTYIVSVNTTGGVTYSKVAEFLYSRYETGGPLIRKQIQNYGGCTTRPTEAHPYGQGRLFCSEWGVRYEVRAAEPDGGAPYFTQGEPERIVLVDGVNFVRLDDLDFYLLDGAGNKTTLQFGSYYPALFTIGTSGVGTTPETSSGRLDFANVLLRPIARRVGNEFPIVQCQFAPGIIAVLVAPRSSYTSAIQTLRVALFSVDTGNMVALSPALLGLRLPVRVTMSCIEQGTIDNSGALLTIGRLVIGISSTDSSPTRGDGWFVITGLRDITWLCREPSNTTPLYVGNQLVPATLGVTTNLRYTKPTAD